MNAAPPAQSAFRRALDHVASLRRQLKVGADLSPVEAAYRQGWKDLQGALLNALLVFRAEQQQLAQADAQRAHEAAVAEEPERDIVAEVNRALGRRGYRGAGALARYQRKTKVGALGALDAATLTSLGIRLDPPKLAPPPSRDFRLHVDDVLSMIDRVTREFKRA